MKPKQFANTLNGQFIGEYDDKITAVKAASQHVTTYPESKVKTLKYTETLTRELRTGLSVTNYYELSVTTWYSFGVVGVKDGVKNRFI